MGAGVRHFEKFPAPLPRSLRTIHYGISARQTNTTAVAWNRTRDQEQERRTANQPLPFRISRRHAHRIGTLPTLHTLASNPHAEPYPHPCGDSYTDWRAPGNSEVKLPHANTVRTLGAHSHTCHTRDTLACMLCANRAMDTPGSRRVWHSVLRPVDCQTGTSDLHVPYAPQQRAVRVQACACMGGYRCVCACIRTHVLLAKIYPLSQHLIFT